MPFYKQKAKNILNPDTEIHYAVQTSYKNSEFPHLHDFYELLLVIKGSQLFIVNDTRFILSESSLILIRPNDVHYKEYLGEGMHINVAFPQKTANDLFNYLGEGFRKDLLLKPNIPPYVFLTNTEKAIVQNSLESLNLLEVYDTQTIRTHLRILLFELLTKYFAKLNMKNDNIPSWLMTALSEMKKKENFICGVPALVKLSGKRHEYLCRSLKKYIDMTPTGFINEQRLNYAANLLLHSDREIVDICLEAGFDNLSHFYHIFKKMFHTTPAEYRKSML